MKPEQRRNKPASSTISYEDGNGNIVLKVKQEKQLVTRYETTHCPKKNKRISKKRRLGGLKAFYKKLQITEEAMLAAEL